METERGQCVSAYGRAVETSVAIPGVQALEGEILAAMGWSEDIASNTWRPPAFDRLREASNPRHATFAIVFNQIEEVHALARCSGNYGRRLVHRIVARHGRIFRLLFQISAALDYALENEGSARAPLQEAMEENRKLSKKHPLLQPFLRPHRRFSQTLAHATRELAQALGVDSSPAPDGDATLVALHWHMNAAEKLIRHGSRFRLAYLLLTPVEEVHRLQLTAFKILAEIIQQPSQEEPDEPPASPPADSNSRNGAHL